MLWFTSILLVLLSIWMMFLGWIEPHDDSPGYRRTVVREQVRLISQNFTGGAYTIPDEEGIPDL